MPAYHVQRSIVIDAPIETVFETVADYRTWTSWSPWLCVDPNAEVTVSENSNAVHSTYQWQGELVGQGEIEHKTLQHPQLIDDEIRFFKPFRSVSQVRFEFASQRQGTEVTWHMDGKLPWFMFWMVSKMDTYIGMDYERGLKMLKDFVETGKVESKSEVMGVVDREAARMLGVKDSASLAEIGPVMTKAFEKTDQAFTAADLPRDGEVLSLYDPVCLEDKRFDFTCGVTVPSSVAAPSSLVARSIPGGKYLQIRHTGAYHHMGNAWSGGYQYARYKKLKLNAKGCLLEVYQNDPHSTPTQDLITDVCIPVR